jgi:cytochrome c
MREQVAGLAIARAIVPPGKGDPLGKSSEFSRARIGAINRPLAMTYGEIVVSALDLIFRYRRGEALDMILKLAIILLLLGASTGSAEQGEPSPLEQRGQALAETMCSQCHAIGRTGRSPHAGAPPFRALDRRLDLDSFVERSREGLMVGHPDMPTFRFTREDGRAFVLYLRSIQAP